MRISDWSSDVCSSDLDPPHGIGGEAEALVGLKLLHALHEADVTFGNQLGDGQAIAAIALGDLGHQPQMGGDKPCRRFRVLMFPPAFGEHIFLLRSQEWKLRSEEHTSELQSLMRISYAVCSLKKKNQHI